MIICAAKESGPQPFAAISRSILLSLKLTQYYFEKSKRSAAVKYMPCVFIEVTDYCTDYLLLNLSLVQEPVVCVADYQRIVTPESATCCAIFLILKSRVENVFTVFSSARCVSQQTALTKKKRLYQLTQIRQGFVHWPTAKHSLHSNHGDRCRNRKLREVVRIKNSKQEKKLKTAIHNIQWWQVKCRDCFCLVRHHQQDQCSENN